MHSDLTRTIVAFLLGLGFSAFLVTTWHSYAIGKIERRLEAVETKLHAQ